ncbi:MAG: hypothetical protein WCU88_13785 [Elusimicrobiota bacterium]|jgi:hypothetical protein
MRVLLPALLILNPASGVFAAAVVQSGAVPVGQSMLAVQIPVQTLATPAASLAGVSPDALTQIQFAPTTLRPEDFGRIVEMPEEHILQALPFSVVPAASVMHGVPRKDSAVSGDARFKAAVKGVGNIHANTAIRTLSSGGDDADVQKAGNALFDQAPGGKTLAVAAGVQDAEGSKRTLLTPGAAKLAVKLESPGPGIGLQGSPRPQRKGKVEIDISDDIGSYYYYALSAERFYGTHRLTWDVGAMGTATQLEGALQGLKAGIEREVGDQHDVIVRFTEMREDFYDGGTALWYSGYVEISGVGKEYFYSPHWDWDASYHRRFIHNDPREVAWGAFKTIWLDHLKTQKYRETTLSAGREYVKAFADIIRRKKWEVPADLSSLDNDAIRRLMVRIMRAQTEEFFPDFWLGVDPPDDTDEERFKKPFISELKQRRTENEKHYNSDWLERQSLKTLAEELKTNRQRDARTKKELEARGLSMPESWGEAVDKVNAYDRTVSDLTAEIEKRGIPFKTALEKLSLRRRLPVLQFLYNEILTSEMKERIYRDVLKPAGMSNFRFDEDVTLGQMEKFLDTFHNDSVREELAAVKKDVDDLQSRVTALGKRVDKVESRLDSLSEPRSGIDPEFLAWWNSNDKVAVDMKYQLAVHRQRVLQHYLEGGF